MHGNILKSEALDIGNMIEIKMTSFLKNLSPVLAKQMLPYRQYEVPKGL